MIKYWDRAGLQQSDQMQYNASYSTPSDGFAWSSQAGNEVLSYTYGPQEGSDAIPPALNSFQPPSMLSLRFSAVSPIVPPNPDRAPTPPQLADVLSGASNKRPEHSGLPLMSPSSSRPLQAPAARRSKYAALDWDRHKRVIQKLYLDEEKPLEEVMKIMTTEYSFNAPVKQYKEKFKHWGWCKYLSNEMAQWMLAKGDKRRIESRKETIFLLGGRVWTLERIQRSTRRTRKEDVETIANAPTPLGVTYKTPHDITNSPSPHNALSPQISFKNTKMWTPTLCPSTPQLNSFRITSNGHTRAELVSMQREAQELDQQGRSEEAENKLLEALSGLEQVLSPTHEDTNAVAYQLATFYTYHNRINDADKVLGWMSENHVRRWGLKDEKTTAHVLHVVDLLNSWFRPEDALTFLYRATEVWENPDGRQEKGGSASGNSRNRSGNPQSRLSDVFRMADDNPSALDSRLGSAKAHVNAKDESIEPILLSLISQCEKSPGTLAVKNIRARCELIQLYQNLQREEDRIASLTRAREFLADIWKSDSEKSKELMEASVDVAKLLVQAGKAADAKDVLRSVEQEAVDSFGPDDDRTIWLLMRIGVMYQNEHDWDEAEPRFEQALAASMTQHGLEDGLTKTLESALEKRHYSYLSRESGAFKSILGTSGIVIRPGSFFLGSK
ncbi:hypothetical protein ONS95_004585 [Cadophora gregata]|uniref:uncharacterized protein n=1 Tax=Cadophora gregata TaxID=51156 RepID=UPI0026DB497F|nr:uncharacterized protein ONS95_004585 [Cadophora gregata]KAK0106080.1 hypothetical protein ONS95_004585 [Cadophora gregata]